MLRTWPTTNSHNLSKQRLLIIYTYMLPGLRMCYTYLLDLPTYPQIWLCSRARTWLYLHTTTDNAVHTPTSYFQQFIKTMCFWRFAPIYPPVHKRTVSFPELPMFLRKCKVSKTWFTNFPAYTRPHTITPASPKPKHAYQFPLGRGSIEGNMMITETKLHVLPYKR